MQNNFSKCREWVPRGTSQHKWRWLTTLLLILTLGIGQMWATDFLYSEITTNGTTRDGITVKRIGLSTTSKAPCGGGSNVNSVAFNGNGDTGNSGAATNCVVVSSANAITSLTVEARSNNSSTGNLVLVFYSTADGGTTCSSYVYETGSIAYNGASADCPASQTITPPTGTKRIEIYRRVNINGTTMFASGNSYRVGSTNQFNVFGISATASSATTYSVTYSAGVGSVKEGKSLPTQAAVAAGTEITLASAGDLEKEGKEFDGWLCNINSTKYAAGAKYTMTAAATTFTAQWRDPAPKFTVSYNLNGASGDAPTETVKAAGDVFNLAAAPSWAGHAFDGWLCSADAGVKAAGSSYTMTAANTTFTAQWHEVDCKIYSLTGGIGSAAVEGGSATVSASALALTGSSDIIKLTPASGEIFKTGDRITISGTAGKTSVPYGIKISASNGKGQELGVASVTGTTIPLIATTTLAADADYLYIVRNGGTTTTLLTCEVHRSCAEGTAAGLSYAEASVNKYTTDAAFTNPLTNINGLVIASYGTSDAEVATVGTNGEVTLVGAGDATITAYTAVQTKAGTLYAAGTASYTLTVSAPPTNAVTYAKGDVGADGTMTDPNSPYVEGAEVTLLANTFTAPSGKEFDEWVVTKTVGGEAVAVSEGKFTMPAAAVTVTATWKDATTKYEITKGTYANGDFTISPTEQAAGEIVTLTATPNEDYLFSAWEAYKTGDPTTTVTVTDNEFTMPAYAVTVNATFTADPRAKVLYISTASTENDKVYEALKDIYNVKVVNDPASTIDQTAYALVVLHESVGGGKYNANAIAAAKAGTTPVLNTKSYFYTGARWNWGSAAAGKKTAGVHVNTDYCNITSHPLFADLTPDANDSIIILSAINSDNKPIQPITSFSDGKAGYTLANVPDGCAIHELTPAQRGAESGKYLMISLYSKDFANLNANGQKLFQNAAAYLIGSTAWEPIAVPTSPEVTATPTAAYSVGDNIALTASATGTSAATTYTWYKGDDLATAKSAGAIKDAATAAAGGNTYEKATSVVEDAGTYWCVISNGTDCEASASLEITVSDASYNITFVSAHGSAPAATTGVSYTLPELSESGWKHQGWTASIDVTVDADPVTAGTTIANDKTALFAADVEFTAVWTQIYDVTFNMQDHGAAIDAQHILDGGKATKPADPIAIGYDFGGWYKEAACTNAWDFANDVVTEDTELFAKWTAFTGCVEVYPAASGDALTVDATVALQSGSTGATIKVANLNGEKTIDYNAYGLSFSSGGKDSVRVTLNNDLQVGSVITVRLVSNGTTNSSGRGLNLFNAAHVKKALLGWQASEEVAKYDELSFSYTVTETDGFAGTNVIGLGRQNSVFLKSLKVSNCGAAIIYHDLTSAITPDHDPAYATVTLGATSVREGYTTTATYSAIDEAYEFDEWQISGTGASIEDASANPAVITMGTTDAVVTLKLKTATPKHTVTYDVKGHGVVPASEDVKEGSKVTKPADPSETGWAFCGWYKETTLENAWNFDVDVMSTEDITLYAKWEDETGAIKLFDGEGNLNTAKFITPAKTTIEINSTEYPTLVSFGSNRTSLSQAKQADMVMYSAATDATKIKFELYNANSSAKDVYLWLVEEGDENATAVATVNVPGETRITTSYYTFNGTKNRSFYLTSGSKADVKVMQVTVLDNGNDIPQFGKAGYSVDFNKGRIASAANGTISFEGATIGVKSEYSVLNSTSLSLNTYIQFNNAVANTVVKIKKASTNKYYVTNDLDNKGTEYSSDQEITLTATGTWYIGSVNPGSAAALSKIEFIAPKCAEPTITPMVNSDLCEGDVFAPLTVSADVSDEGTLHYAWYKHPTTGDDEAVGTDAASFTPEADGQYYVIVTNKKDGYSDNSATSNTITVEHFASAVITTAPLNKRAEAGQNATLTVAATGKNVSYAWFTCDENGDNEVAIDGASGTDKTSLLVPVTTSFEQWYKVKVTSDCGNTEAIAKVSEFVPATPANVTTSILWDWTSSAWPASGEVQFSDKITDGTDFSKDYELLANADAIVPNNDGFHSDMLYGKGQYVWRSGNKFFQGTAIKFNTTVAGMVRVYYRSTGNNKHVNVEVKNGANTTLAGTYETGDFRWSDYVEVEAGAVEILCTATDANKAMTRIQKIEFLALEDRRADTWVKPGELGTVCLKNDAMVMGANIYALAGLDENGYLAFNQISNGELVAGKPYLFEATRSGNVSFYKTLNAGHADEADVTNGMHGTFSDMTFSPNTAESEGIYYFSGTHIWKVDDFSVSITVPAYRCYVDYDAVLAAGPAQAPAAGCRRVTLGVNGKNNATDVENLNASEAPVKLIIDGKMYILRGEKLFDATGRLVK